jgi:NhaC family Na+:H+ antiporter
MSERKTGRDPYIWEATLSLVAMIAAISVSIIKFGADPHIPILIGVVVTALIGLKAGYSWEEIEKGMVNGIANSLQAVIILCFIGVLIGVWMMSGVVPTLLYYGLQILHPSIFLPATLIICSVTSLATGTSWGTAGTIGIALVGIGESLGFPLPVVAGAVISGAYFGDKMSPLSETTNLAPAMVGTDLYTHIKHMTYTTGAAYAITLAIEIVLGFIYGSGSGSVANVTLIMETLSSNYNISIFMMLPPLVIVILSVKKVPAIPGIICGILSAIALGMLIQENNFGDVLTASFSGFTSSTGVEAVDNLLTKGGLDSMSYTILIIICSMMFGGIMESTNQLKVIVDAVLLRARTSKSLITATVFTGVASNLILAEQYMAIVITGRMYAQAYREKGLHPKNLSRAVEDSATVTGALVPWNSCGAYMAGTLGVATLAYLPFAVFNWISPLVSILFGILGITIHDLDKVQERIEALEITRGQGAVEMV